MTSKSTYEQLISYGEDYANELDAVYCLKTNKDGSIASKQPANPINIEIAIHQCRIRCRFNLMTKECEYTLDSQEIHDSAVERFNYPNRHELSMDLAYVVRCRLLLEPQIDASVRVCLDVMRQIALRNAYHPVVDWIPVWDGVDRWQQFYDLIEVHEDYLHPEMKCVYMRKVILQCIQAWFGNVKGKPQQIGQCLVLAGLNGIGKTQFIRRLLPEEWVKTGVVLRFGRSGPVQEADCVNLIAGYAIVELGELEDTFAKADMGGIKRHLTETVDEGRTAYSTLPFKYPRTTVHMASVNRSEFLHDIEGARRFWIIHCKRIDWEIDVEFMRQLFAQAHVEWTNGSSYFLEGGEDIKHQAQVIEHRDRAAAAELLDAMITAGESVGNAAVPRNITTICELVGIRFSDRKSVGELKDVLRERGYKKYTTYRDDDGRHSNVYIVKLHSSGVSPTKRIAKLKLVSDADVPQTHLKKEKDNALTTKKTTFRPVVYKGDEYDEGK